MITQLETDMNLLSEKVLEKELYINKQTSREPELPEYNTLDERSEALFEPGRSLQIEASGIGLLRFPLSSSQLDIPIYDIADGSLVYTSKRSRRCSGDAILSDAQHTDLVHTKYFFGPNRDPELSILCPSEHTPPPYQPSDQGNQSHPETEKPQEVAEAGGANLVHIKTKWLTRSICFTNPAGFTFEWTYVSTKNKHTGRRVNLIVLKLAHDQSKSTSKSNPEPILAQLVRSDETRPLGSSRATAGNGGRLQIGRRASQYIDESLIVATCLANLKREIDRRRTIQAAVLAGVASGGL